MRLRLLSGKRVEESKLRVNALPFVPRQTLNSITTESFFNSDSAHGSKRSLIFENLDKSNLNSSQDSGGSPVLNYKLSFIRLRAADTLAAYALRVQLTQARLLALNWPHLMTFRPVLIEVDLISKIYAITDA